MKFKMVLQRLKEPSTWSSIGGLGVLAIALGVSVEDWALWSTVGTAVAALLLGILFGEKGGAK